MGTLELSHLCPDCRAPHENDSLHSCNTVHCHCCFLSLESSFPVLLFLLSQQLLPVFKARRFFYKVCLQVFLSVAAVSQGLRSMLIALRFPLQVSLKCSCECPEDLFPHSSITKRRSLGILPSSIVPQGLLRMHLRHHRWPL